MLFLMLLLSIIRLDSINGDGGPVPTATPTHSNEKQVHKVEEQDSEQLNSLKENENIVPVNQNGNHQHQEKQAEFNMDSDQTQDVVGTDFVNEQIQSDQESFKSEIVEMDETIGQDDVQPGSQGIKEQDDVQSGGLESSNLQSGGQETKKRSDVQSEGQESKERGDVQSEGQETKKRSDVQLEGQESKERGDVQSEGQESKEWDDVRSEGQESKERGDLWSEGQESKEQGDIQSGGQEQGDVQSGGQQSREEEHPEQGSQSVSGAEKREPKFEASRSMDVSDQSSVDGSMEDSDKTGSARGDESCSATNLGNCDGNSVYLPEEEEPEYDKYVEAIDLIYSMSTDDKTRGYQLLEETAKKGNTRSKEQLAYGYIFGSQLERNFTRAYEIFSELASKGSPIGQQGLGFMYSSGIGVKSNQAKAVVHYVFAALGGHQFAQMVMGYRTFSGVGVVQSCEGALAYYQKSAEAVINKASLISGGIAVSKVRLMDEDDEIPSIYGVSEDEMVHYQSIFTDSGNTGAQFMLGIYYMFGMAGAQRNFKMALNFLQQAAKDKLPAAYALIGKIYAEGSEEIPQDFDLAYANFKSAADLKHGDGFSGLGLLYYNGMGVRKDRRKAIELFEKAADRGSPEGQYYLGKIYFTGDGVRRDRSKAIKYFQLASHGGHLHALYTLGKINADGTIKRNCNFAMELFKSVSERGKFTRMFTEAQRLYSIGDVNASFMIYLLLAELGFEIAQSNVAYLLEQGELTFIKKEEQLKRGLIFWNRAAAQGYSQARVRLGDYYYYGMGTEVSYEAAATQYRMASDKLGTPQAMFNLGYMYEHGEGLEKDYYLAKRYYDMAAEASSEALVPVNLALLKLNTLYMLEHYRDWLDIQSMLGGQWDIYLISVLVVCVTILILWRIHH